MRQRGAQRRGDERRDLIATAALDLLDEEGLAAITHRAIAARSGVPSASVAYYFPTADSLVEAALDRMVAREIAVFEAVGQELADPDSRSSVVGERLAEVLGWLVRGSRPAQLAQFEVLVHAGRAGVTGGPAGRWLTAYEELAARLLATAGVPAPDVAARVVIASLFGLALVELVEPLSDDALAAACTRLIEGLRNSS